MKKITLILLAFATLVTLTKCNNASSDELSSNADGRAKTISALMNNDAYMNQVMDSMRTKHPDAILSAVFTMAKSDKQMQEMMMNKMTDMCKMDITMTKMVVSKTMKMLDESNFDCCTTGKMMMSDSMAMNHDNQSDCCKKGKMATGKTGEMSAADKLNCCLMAAKKSTPKVK
jgi:hypothetical protein